MNKPRILVWTDKSGVYTQERPIAYEEGIHNVIADFLNAGGEFEAVPVAVHEDSLLPESLGTYQGLVMWGHGQPMSFDVQRSIVEMVEKGAIGVVGLHSILVFHANPLLVARLFGQTERYGWEDDVPMRYTVVRSEHPVFADIDFIELNDEAYYEPFGLVEGHEILLQMHVPNCETRQSNIFNPVSGRYEKRDFNVAGLVSRAAWTYRVGRGRTLFFQPGHETCPTYRNHTVKEIIKRAVRWVLPG